MVRFFSFCLPFRKAGGLQIPCCQGIAVADYSFTLHALALKPSSFCNVGVKMTVSISKGLRFAWVGANAGFGKGPVFCLSLDQLGQQFVEKVMRQMQHRHRKRQVAIDSHMLAAGARVVPPTN